MAGFRYHGQVPCLDDLSNRFYVLVQQPCNGTYSDELVSFLRQRSVSVAAVAGEMRIPARLGLLTVSNTELYIPVDSAYQRNSSCLIGTVQLTYAADAHQQHYALLSFTHHAMQPDRYPGYNHALGLLRQFLDGD